MEIKIENIIMLICNAMVCQCWREFAPISRRHTTGEDTQKRVGMNKEEMTMWLNSPSLRPAE